MLNTRMLPLRFKLLAWLLLAAIGLTVIVYMSINVVRDLRLLNSASSDNVQWTLSQVEVEFLEYELYLTRVVQDPNTDLKTLRREFDVFYSRVRTLRESSLYASLRQTTQFSDNLSIVQAFLDGIVPVIDSSDAELVAALPALLQMSQDVRSNVRALSNSGLNFFARDSDSRRTTAATTLTQLATGVTILLLALLFLAFYLNRLNSQNIKRRAEVIQASKRMKIVTDTALDAVIVSDPNGLVLDFNTAAEQIFGHRASDAIGQSLADLIVPDHHLAAHEAGMDRMRKHGEKHVVGKGRVKLEAKRAGGEIFPVELAIRSADTDEGEIFIAFLRDISHRVNAEQELVAARDRALAGEKAKTDFLATMSHEIRTPLNGLLGNLALLRDTKLSAKQARYIKNMDTSGKLLMSHISDVLDITKYDAGKLRLWPVAMNISTLMQDIVDNQSGAASANNTTLQWGWEGTPADWIRADRDRIQHILMNVIGNAVKFTHDGSVAVTAEVIGEPDATPELSITVSDTGIGIDSALQAEIFDDFMTGDSSYDRDVGGTGLGLGIAQRFVKALGGAIEVESEKGNGSTFVIRFPIEPIAPPEAVVKRYSGGSIGQASHILLVEDNEINRVVAREMLMAAGHMVTEAHNGRIAVDLAEEQRFDLILMDISMPVLDGRGATKAIRAGKGASAQTPIVALTANAMAEEQQAYLADGMNDIVTKPLTRETLIQVISGHIELGPKVATDITESSTVVAFSYIDDLRDSLGVDALQSLLDRFVAEVDETLEQLKDFEAFGLKEAAERAHRIAGSAAVMGAVNLRAALIEVEEASKAQDHKGTQAAIDALPGIWAKTQPFMQAQRRSVGS
jgi:PAS domain S-box-containing protein